MSLRRIRGDLSLKFERSNYVVWSQIKDGDTAAFQPQQYFRDPCPESVIASLGCVAAPKPGLWWWKPCRRDWHRNGVGADPVSEDATEALSEFHAPFMRPHQKAAPPHPKIVTMGVFGAAKI